MKLNLSLASSISKLFTTTLTYIICFTTILTIYHKEVPVPYYMFGIPLVLICYYFIQNYCYHPFVYILLHAAFFIPALLIPFPYVEYRYLYLAMLVFESVHAILIQRKSAEKSYEDVPWYIFVGICLIYMTASEYQLTTFTTLIYYLGLGLLLLHFIRYFLSGLNKLLSGSEQTTSMPIKKILLNNTYVFLLFLLVFISFAIFIQHSDVDKTLGAFGQIILNAIGFIIRFIFYAVTLIRAFFSTESEVYETEQAEQNVEKAFDELSEPTLFAQILDGIITIATFCLIIYCIYHLVTWLVKLFSKRYAQDTDTIIQLSRPKETTEQVKTNTSIIKKIKVFFSNDNASKIRRGYRIKIKSYKSLTYRESNTPIETAEQIYNTYHENIEELTQVYEKARYSHEEITFEDVQKGGIL